MPNPVWFIEPLDGLTNLAVQQALDELLKQATQPTKLSGVLNNVWEAPAYSFVDYLQRSKNLHSLRFKIYMKTGDTIQRYRLHEPEVRKRSKKRMIDSKRAHAEKRNAKPFFWGIETKQSTT